MDCNCGNKNEGNFPPSVLQVNSAECPVLFHKVVIPTNFGDETETPVLMGERRNTLVYYEVNGHTYLYSSDGVPTRLDRGGASVLYVDELPETSKAMQDTLYVSSRGELAVYKSGDKKILNEKPTYYTTLGNNTDGAMTQKAVTDALSVLSEEVKNKLAEFKNGVVDKVMPEVNEKVSGMERFVTTKIEEMKRETSTLVNTTTNDVNLMNNKLNKHIEQADIAKNDLLDKIRRNTDSITDTKNSLRNYALISDVDNRVSDAEARTNNKIIQAKTEVEGKISALDARLTKQASDNKADITQLKANLNTTNSALLTHKEQADKKFDDIKVEQPDQNNLISDILNVFSKESDKGTNLKLNSSATKVLGMTIYGNTEQNRYTGKNLLKLSTNPTISNGLSSTVSDDGLVKYSSKITDSWGDITTLLYFPAPLPAGKYTFSIDHPRTHRIIFKYRLADGSFSEIIANMTATSTSNTFTTTQPIIAGYLYIAAANGSNLNDTVKAQLEIGDTATDYEPYTGGYNNLFDEFSELPKTINGLKLENVNGILKLTGMPTTDWNTMLSQDITAILSDKTDYTVVQYNVYGSKLYPAVVAYRADGSGADEINAITSKVFNFRVDKTKYNRYAMKLQTATRASFSGPVTIYNNYALFQGNYTADNLPEYSPYNTGLASPRPQLPQPINGVSGTTIYTQGKNLFDTRFGERTINGVSIKIYPDGSFELNGTPTNGFSLTNVFGSKSYVPSGSYKIKVEIISGSVQKIEPSATFLCVYTIQLSSTGSNSEYIREADIVSENIKEFTNTVDNPKSDIYTPYIWIPYHIENKKAFYSYNNLRMRATLVPNGENTDFVEFDSNTISANLPTLHKVGDYQDYITIRDNKWYLVKNTTIKILNGSENWIKTAEPENIFICQNIINATKNYDDAFFSHFNNIKRYPNIDKTGAIRGDNGTNIAFCMNNISTVTNFKNWLNQNNVTVLHPIAQPITTEITDSTTLAELKKLMEMRTYKGVTNISVTGGSLVPDIKVKYMRKIGE